MTADFLRLKSSYDQIYAEIGLHADDPSFHPRIVKLLLKNVGGGGVSSMWPAEKEGLFVKHSGRD